MYKKIAIVAGISLLFTIAIFFILYSVPSLFTFTTHDVDLKNYSERIDHAFMYEVYTSHITHPEFFRRPLVSLAIDMFHRLFDVSYAYAFIGINAILLFLCGVVLYVLSRKCNHSHIEALISLVLFYTGFTIVFGFTAEISAYDDLLQYIFLWLSIYCVIYNKWYGLCIALFLALLTRETSLLVVPGLVILAQSSQKFSWKQLNDNAWRWIVSVFAIVMIGYASTLLIAIEQYHYLDEVHQYFTTERWVHFTYSFQSSQYALHAIVSALLAFGMPLFILYEYVRHHKLSSQEYKMFVASVITLIINTPIVYISTRASESRLLALPLVFVWPLLGKYAQWMWYSSKERYHMIKKIVRNYTFKDIFILFRGFFLLFCAYVISFFVYEPVASEKLYIFFRGYLFVFFTLLIAYYSMQSFFIDTEYDHTNS